MNTKLQPPGELIDVNGRKVHIQRMGQGSPTVLFESGLFSDSLIFGKVQPEIAKFTSTISYDRAGMGYSEPRTKPIHSIKMMANELFELLEVLSINEPIVLVGWSAGGVICREFAHQHPELAAGMVLIDSAHENQGNRMSLIEKLGFQITAWNFTRYSRMTHEEILRKLGDAPYWENRAPETHKYYQDQARPESFEFFLQLVPFAKKDMAQGDDALRSLGSLPLTVISRVTSNHRGLKKLLTSKAADEMQREISERSTNSKEIKVDCGHDIANERAGAVIDAIKAMVQNVRK